MPPRLTLGRALKKHGITKYAFAKRLGASYPGVFQYFRPAYNPTFKMMCRWAKAIGCKISDLYSER